MAPIPVLYLANGCYDRLLENAGRLGKSNVDD